jgi:hypothetical protein
MRDQFFASAGFAINQHGRIGGRDCFDVLQDALENLAGADDLFEVVLGADLFFEIELLFFELVFEFVDLPERKRVLNGDRDLLADLVQQFSVVGGESVFLRRECRARDRVR